MMNFQPNNKVPYVQLIGENSYPVVFIDTLALMKMYSYVQQSDKEISWLGTVERDIENNMFLITDVLLVPQNTTGTTADLCEAGLSALGSRLLKEGKIDVYNSIRMWGHSHVKAPVDPSETDNETFKQFYENCDYFIRLITNKLGAMKIDIVDCENKVQYMNVTWYENKSEEQTQLEELINTFFAKQDKIQEEIDETIKFEMDGNIDKAKFKKKDKIINSLVVVGGGKISNPPYVLIRESDHVLKYVGISDIFTDDDILLLMNKCDDENDLQIELCFYDEFDKYEMEDWKKLWNKIKEYYYSSYLSQK